MINFTELKEKLTEFDEKTFKELALSHNIDYLSDLEPMAAAKNQHTKDSKIISELLEIIEMQNNEIRFACRFKKETGVELLEDCEPENQMNMGFVKCLFETESKLKQLIKGV